MLLSKESQVKNQHLRPHDVIRKKRDGIELTTDEINFFVEGVANNTFANYQAAALLMAIFLRGMTTEERNALTNAMLHSGQVLDFSNIAKPKVDKHSTGGVGDKTSLIVAPLAAACGLCVPMISGRGLGHTGGTLDKLEAIPGYRVHISLEEFRRILNEVGFAMIGQTSEIAPVDKKLYALRDVTATVECIPLIAASIMSKKLAEGLDGLVLDVKTGDGAFMKSLDDSMQLAQALCEIGRAAGVNTTALVTSMEQPLGYAIGNSLEVIECVEILMGEDKPVSRDLKELSIELTAWMLVAGKIVNDIEAARVRVIEVLESGAGRDKFVESVSAQGGSEGVFYGWMPQAQSKEDLLSERDGYVSRIRAESVGVASMKLGAGRMRVEDKIDAAVGVVLHVKVGDAVKQNDALVTLHYNDATNLAEAKRMIYKAFDFADEPPAALPLVRAIV